jgi:hypothetical protein
MYKDDAIFSTMMRDRYFWEVWLFVIIFNKKRTSNDNNTGWIFSKTHLIIILYGEALTKKSR